MPTKAVAFKFALAFSIVLLLWIVVPAGLGVAAFYLNDFVVVVHIILSFVVVTVFLLATRFAKRGYKLTVAHGLAVFALTVAAYVWLTLGSFSEYSAMLLLEPFVITLLVASVVVYVIAITFLRRAAA